MGPTSAPFIHTVVEAMKLAFADREAYYGDPDFVNVPIETLLSDAYSDERRKLIGDKASMELRPGRVEGYEQQVEHTLKALRELSTTDRKVTGGEPTMASMRSARRGDTVHIDVIDRFGNMIAAMPSGGWLQSSPVIPELGFMLNSRAQMFWLEEGLAGVPATGKAAAHDAHAVARGERRRALHGVRLARWRPTGAMAIACCSCATSITASICRKRSTCRCRIRRISRPRFYPREQKPGHLAAEEIFGAGGSRRVARARTRGGHGAGMDGRTPRGGKPRHGRVAAWSGHAAPDAGLRRSVVRMRCLLALREDYFGKSNVAPARIPKLLRSEFRRESVVTRADEQTDPLFAALDQRRDDGADRNSGRLCSGRHSLREKSRTYFPCGGSFRELER